ncbi:hypothetical protein MKW92_019729 [Papaver armeniacum]|nr:hypothetical protein MKW92_019729 [Papaver armeniacum]
MSFADKIRRAMAKDPINTQANPHSFTLLMLEKHCNISSSEVGRISDEIACRFIKARIINSGSWMFDNTGENLKASQKKEAAKECNCTLGEVENVLGRFRWIKEARKKMDKLKGKETSAPEHDQIQKLMGSTAVDFARSN